jgi:hypothetical protein
MQSANETRNMIFLMIRVRRGEPDGYVGARVDEGQAHLLTRGSVPTRAGLANVTHLAAAVASLSMVEGREASGVPPCLSL